MSIDKNRSKLHEIIVRGKDYREDYEFELYGEEVTAELRPLPDEEFLPIAALLSEKLDLDEEDLEEKEAVSEAIDKVDEEAEGEGEEIDISDMDEEFVAVIQEAAIAGLTGAYDEEGEPVSIEDEEEKRELIRSMMGGYSVEMGTKVLEISGDIREAEKFRGGRGSINDTGN